MATPNRDISRNVIFLQCDKEEESGVPIAKIAQQAHAQSRDLPFKYVNPIQFPLFGNIDTRSNVVDIRVMGDSYKVLEPLVQQIMDIGKNTGGIVFRYTDLALRKPEIQVRIDAEGRPISAFKEKTLPMHWRPPAEVNRQQAIRRGRQVFLR